jgi:hypothetical protein
VHTLRRSTRALIANALSLIAIELDTAAHSLGLRLRALPVALKVDDMFAAFAQQPVDALVVLSGQVTSNWIKQIAAETVKLLVPSISQPRDFADGLLSYGPTRPMSIVRPASMFGAFSSVRSRPTCR